MPKIIKKPWNFSDSKKPCLHCKKVFYFSPSEEKYGRAKYCSQRCWMDSKERKIMMTKVHKGKKCPFARPPHFSGDKHWNWQGGITSINVTIRNSKKYKDWRRSIFERDDYTCQLCGQYGGGLHADHIKPFAYFPKSRFELSNGRTLCVGCHKQTETYLRNYGKNYKGKR